MNCSLLDKVLDQNRIYQGIIVKEKNGHRIHLNWNNGPHFFEQVSGLIKIANELRPDLAAEIVCTISGLPAELKTKIKKLNREAGLPGVCQKT